jgi:uncharacterized protein with LGFP repeats
MIIPMKTLSQKTRAYWIMSQQWHDVPSAPVTITTEGALKRLNKITGRLNPERQLAKLSAKLRMAIIIGKEKPARRSRKQA